MAISHNPTRTLSIERAWFRDIARRWNAYSKRTLGALLASQDQPQLVANGLVVNVDPFVMSAAQQRTYMVFVQAEIDRLLLETQVPPNWQAIYQLEAYERGLVEMRASLIAQGVPIVPTEAERLAAQGLQPFSATPALATSATASRPIHQDALEFLYTRSYDALEGWTDTLARETRQILFNGVEAGINPRDLAGQIQARIGVSQRRAQRIAQTETNQAYSRASAAEADRTAEELEEEVNVRWITARDSRVRHSHAELHGVVMTTDRAREIKNTDGINCRCALTPVIEGTNTKKRQARFERERQQLLLLERK